jgi:transcriptional coactivator HFI1/ADA1
MSGTIRPDAISVSTSTPILSSKSLAAPAISSKPAGKPTVTAPRIDVEPLYTALKSAIGDADWAVYKNTISQFMLGMVILKP